MVDDIRGEIGTQCAVRRCIVEMLRPRSEFRCSQCKRSLLVETQAWLSVSSMVDDHRGKIGTQPAMCQCIVDTLWPRLAFLCAQ